LSEGLPPEKQRKSYCRGNKNRWWKSVFLTFFLDKKSNKKIKPVRMENFFCSQGFSGEPAKGEQAILRAYS